MIWVVFALALGVVVLFVVHALMHSWIRDLHDQQDVLWGELQRVKGELAEANGRLDALEEALDYGRRPKVTASP